MYDLLRKYTVYFSLMVVVINPVPENNDSGEKPSLISGKEQNVSAEGMFGYDIVKENNNKRTQHEQIIDYYKLGKLYLLQGEFTDSYKSFSIGEGLENSGMLNIPNNVLNHQNPVTYSPLHYQNNTIEENPLETYLDNLVSLYLQRIEILAKDPTCFEEALQEIEKIYIIDPHNKQAIRLEKKIHDAQTQSIQHTEVLLSEEDDNNRFIAQDKEQALSAAEQIINASLLTSPNIEAMELTLKEYYDEGKVYLQSKDYFKAIVAFRKVLAFNAHHVYAEYAREFIDIATEKIREKERMDLQLIRESYRDEEKISDIATVSPNKKAVPAALLNLTRPAESLSVEDLNTRKNKLLHNQIDNVIASVNQFIAEKKYVRAQENLDALLKIAPKHEETHQLMNRVVYLLEEQKEEARIKRIEEEEGGREKYFTAKQHRDNIRKTIEQKYKQWNTMNREAMQRELKTKIAEKLYNTQNALFMKDYLKAKQELDLLFMLHREHKEAKAIQEELLGTVEYLQTVICDSDTVKEPADTPVVKSSVLATISNFRPAPLLMGTVDIQVEGKNEVQDRGVQLLSSFEKEVLAHDEHNTIFPDYNSVEGRRDEDEVNQMAMIEESHRKEIPSEIQEQELHEKFQGPLEKWQKINLTFQENTERKLKEYFDRGKQHFKQCNYSLALVSFNKVKSLDKNDQFLREVEELIIATKEQLESTNNR
ncbi:MAG: hypothetical protein KKH94_13415 [Candidatus Omnitrophica bacterium]|nr:hypothetical protein [Candidatus Omnitrophota bacterium]